jgi:hypothetical protein
VKHAPPAQCRWGRPGRARVVCLLIEKPYEIALSRVRRRVPFLHGICGRPCRIIRVKAQESMTVEHDHERTQAASGEHEATGGSEKRSREAIGFFGSLVGLVSFGLGILPDSTVGEKFLVVVAAIALSCVILLAIRLVPQSRAAVWLAVSGTISVGCLMALSLVAQDTAAPPSAPAAAEVPTLQGSAASSSANPASTPSAIQSAVTPQADGYLSDYVERPFTMPGDACQYSDTDNASQVSFTQQKLTVAVTDNNDGDMDIGCNGFAETATLLFNDQAAPVTGNPSPSKCAAAITTNPISGSVAFSQLQQGEEFCFIAGYPSSASGPLIFVKLTSVAGTPTFTTTWAATAWQTPSSNS